MSESTLPESVYAITVPLSINRDARLVIDGWICGYLSCDDVMKVVEEKRVHYYTTSSDIIDGFSLIKLNRHIAPYLKSNDPEPYLSRLVRSEAYLYDKLVFTGSIDDIG